MGLAGSALEDSYHVYRQPGVLSQAGEVSAEALETVVQAMQEEGLLSGAPPHVETFLLPRWEAAAVEGAETAS